MQYLLVHISDAMKHVARALFWSDSELMSDEIKHIMSNPKDADEYKKAVESIEKGEKKEVTITLSDKSELTLVQ